MSTVFGTLLQPNGDPATGYVVFYLVGDNGPVLSAIDTSGSTVVLQSSAPLDATGSYTIDVTSNDDIIPANTVWARSYHKSRIIDTLDVGTAGPYDETDIRADPPGALTPSGLAAHAADDTLHGGGQSLGVALISTEFSISVAGPTDIPGAALSFIAPDRDYVVEFVARMLVATSAAVGQVSLLASIGLASPAAQGSDGLRAPVANELDIVRYSLYVPGPQVVSPNSPDWHKPVPGDTVNYKLQLARPSGSGTVTITPDNALLGKSLSYLRAYTV